MILRFLFIACLLLNWISNYGQEFPSAPPSIKWHQINTTNFKIIFQEGFDGEAQRTANTLQHLYKAGSKSLGNSPPKISVVLHSQTSESNGFVTLTPRHSEFFTTSPQNYNFLGNNDWIEFLAVHEFRHVVQFDKTKTGFNKLLHIFFGPLAHSTMAFLATPPWFWEGDAVGIETALTSTGRGRIPNFNLVFRTNLLERGAFSYNKQHLLSYKHFVPNHYRLGYFMTTYMRNKYGSDIWDRVITRANKRSFLPFTFSNSIKKETGKYLVPTYNEMMDEMGSLWKKQQEKLTTSGFTKLNSTKKRGWTNYSFPQELANGRVLVMKSGIGDIQQFVSIGPDGDEKVEFIPGTVNNAGMLSAKGTKIVWNQLEFNPRWQRKSYSVIKIYDTQTQLGQTITPKGKYSAADISHDLSRIVTISTLEDNSVEIQVFDGFFGELQKRFDNPGKAFFSMPRWSGDDSKIVVLKTANGKKSVVTIDYQSSQEIELIPPGDENIGHPVLSGNYLLYNSPYNGIDNIYALDLQNKGRYRVTSSKYGSYNPSISSDGSIIYYNDYTKDGMDVVSAPFDPSSWTPIAQVDDLNIRFYDTVVEQEGSDDILDNIPENNFPTKRYRKISGMINPVSWGPFVAANTRELFVGVQTADILNTTAINLGYIYNQTNETGKAIARVSYHNWFPVIDFEADYGNRRETGYFSYINLLSDTTAEGINEAVDFDWIEKTVKAGLRIPLNFSNSKYSANFTISNSVGLTKVESFDFNQIDTVFFFNHDLQQDGSLVFNQFEISYTHLLKRSKRDINSKWGQFFTLERFGTPYGGDFKGGLTTLRVGLFFPGFFKHHSIFLRGGIQTRDIELTSNEFWFANRIEFPRGFGSDLLENYSIGSVNYALPLVYPDLSIGPVLNIQRIKANLFYDIATGEIDADDEKSKKPGFEFPPLKNSPNYYSFGLELTMDFNLFRYITPFELGVRLISRNDPFDTGDDPFAVELIIGTFGF